MTNRLAMLGLFCGFNLWGACLPVDGPVILARHLASILPSPSSIEGTTPLGPAPAIGHRRILTSSDLESWARRFNLSFDPKDEICLERQTVPLDSDIVLAAVVAALQREFKLSVSRAQVQSLEFEALLPDKGQVTLAASGLGWLSDKQMLLWRGHVQLESSPTRYPVSIRFRLDAFSRRFVASRDLDPMTILSTDDIQAEQVPWRPNPQHSEPSLEELVGKALRRRILKGSPLLAIHVKAPPLILAGEPVEFISRAGLAQIRIKATATHNAYAGEVVIVRREDSAALLRGIAFAPGVVLIDKQQSRGRLSSNPTQKGIVNESASIDSIRQP